MNFNISYLLVLVPNIISLIVSQIYRSEWNDKTYRNMVKPKLNPPSYVFGIVWPILYLLMAISLFIVWNAKICFPYCNAVTYFFIQLFFNLIWTTLFLN